MQWRLQLSRLPAIRALASPAPHSRLQSTLLSTHHVASNLSDICKSQEKFGSSPLQRPLHLPLSTVLVFSGARSLSSRSSRDFKINGTRSRRKWGGQGQCSQVTGVRNECSLPHLLARCYSSLQDSKDRPKG